jgi:hypothetical protein
MCEVEVTPESPEDPEVMHHIDHQTLYVCNIL